MAGDMSNSMESSSSDERRALRENARQDIANFVNVSATERIASAVAGGFLTMFGLRRRGAAGYGMALLGAELLYRGASGHCKTYSVLGVSTKEFIEPGTPVEVDPARAISVRQSVYVGRPRDELFAMWRDFSKLPQFMEHLERVDVISPTKSRWVVAGPAGSTVEWDAEIVDERENEWIAWRTIEPAQVPNNGTVMFCEMSDGGTDVFVTLEAQPPAGKLGELVARMFGRAPKRQVRQALQRFKEIAEADEMPYAEDVSDTN